MKDERLYSALLVLYPPSFRREYGQAMIEAFRELRVANRRSTVRFWLFVSADVCRSAWREQLDACHSGMRRFFLQWVGVCTLGVGVTAILANLLNWSFSYLYHPYLESLSLSPWTYGAFLGGGLGIAQSSALRHRFRMGATWILVSAISAALGLELAVMVSDAAGTIVSGVVLGACVGSGQWLVLRTQTRRAGWWIAMSTLGLPAGVLTFGGAMHSTLAGMNPIANPVGSQAVGALRLDALTRALHVPRSWGELLVQIALIATSGIVIGAFTARSVSSRRTSWSRWSPGL